jgi:hypothetical protein
MATARNTTVTDSTVPIRTPFVLLETPPPEWKGNYGAKPKQTPKQEPQEEAPAFYDPWEDAPPVEFPYGVFTAQVEDTILTLAHRSGICPAMLSMAHLAAVSGATHKNSRFQPYSADPTWTVPPIIWVMVIADSGQRKTAAQELAFGGLREADSETWRRYFSDLRRWKTLPAKQRKEIDPPVEPVPIIAEDVTPEKLQQYLSATNRGILYLKDEIAGLLEFGRYSNGSGAAERGFFLQAYEGRHYTVARVTRGALPIEVNAVTIYGAIQPERLKDFKDLEKDGFIQRMSMLRSATASISRPDVIAHGYSGLRTLITDLSRGRDARFTADQDGEALIRQTEADGRWFATVREFGDGFVGWCHKMHGLHARYSLILHLLDGAEEAVIPAATIKRAGILVREFLLPNARDFFGVLPGAPIQRTQDIAGWALASAPDRILASDIKANVRSCRGLSTKELNDAVDPLVTGAWLRPENDFPSNRAWFVTAGLRQHFAERSQQEREKRAEARAIIQSISSARGAAAWRDRARDSKH